MEYYAFHSLHCYEGKDIPMTRSIPTTNAPLPAPPPPPRNHPHFQPAGLARAEVSKESLSLFFCRDLPPKSAAYKIMAAVVKDDHHTLRQLLTDPANLPDFVNGNGVSPVMVAAARGNIMCLEILAAHPLVNLQRETPAGWTALHYAAHLHQVEAIQSLLKHFADYTKRNKFGEIAFDLAKGETVQNAFWQHKDFVRYMKKLKPEHPRFTPKNATPAAAEEKATAVPAEDKLRLDFVASAARIALTAQNGLRIKIIDEVVKQLDTITSQDLMACCRTLTEAENDTPQAKNVFDWNRLFIETAKSGRADLIAPLAKYLEIEDQKILNSALYHCLRVTDAPDAVAMLLQLGADPLAKAPAPFMTDSKDNIIAFKAFESRRPEAFRQICLWTDKLPHWKNNKEHLQSNMRLWHGRSFQVNDPVKTEQIKHKMNIAIDLHDQRQYFGGMSARGLIEHLDDALEANAKNVIAAIYAESHVPRLLRDNIIFTKDTGAHIMAAMLSAGDTTSAKRLVADGYHLKHALRSDALQTIEKLKNGKYGEAAKAFTLAHLDGTLVIPKVETPADRMRDLAEIAARTPTISGRGGFF
jgi:hypothetical protein